MFLEINGRMHNLDYVKEMKICATLVGHDLTEREILFGRGDGKAPDAVGRYSNQLEAEKALDEIRKKLLTAGILIV